jgi:hypothetical protein
MKINWKNITMVLAVGLLAACEVIGPGDRNIEIFTPTDPSAVKRTSLLIEYSGWRCVNCPVAAEEAHHLKEQYGENLMVVVMHPESNPNTRYGSNQAYNYTCPEADSIYVKMGGTNTTPFPTGNVNMVKDEVKGYFSDHDKWGTQVSQAYSAPKPVLVNVDAYPTDTNIIFVAVDITNLDSLALDANLQVWLTEDSVMGSQYQPDGSRDTNYAHNHLLRASISPLWGEQVGIDSHMTHQVVYEYTLPEKVVMKNCNIVAVVSTEDEVIQAKEGKIQM